jgi:hypothetical protein
MIRTQIQLPDELYRAAKEFAGRKEWSLAEVVRRGLENLLSLYPEKPQTETEWKLPEPRDLGIREDFFDNPDWRYEANMTSGALQLVREKSSRYKTRKKK